MVDSIVQRHDSNIELIAAQALSMMIGIKLATLIVEQLNAYHALRHSPTLFNQRYSKDSLKAKALADTDKSFITLISDERSLLKPLAGL